MLTICLNPCFSGGWSRRKLQEDIKETKAAVLILVLVEDGLGDLQAVTDDVQNYMCLNPCFSGGWSRRAYDELEKLMDVAS